MLGPGLLVGLLVSLSAVNLEGGLQAHQWVLGAFFFPHVV